jgi:hypothetical protein
LSFPVARERKSQIASRKSQVASRTGPFGTVVRLVLLGAFLIVGRNQDFDIGMPVYKGASFNGHSSCTTPPVERGLMRHSNEMEKARGVLFERQADCLLASVG